MRAINHKRTHEGLPHLRWDRQLGYVARRHARVMAGARSVYHDLALGHELTNWRALGQNSGSGDSCGQLVRAFWRSTGHRANILGRWRFMGVGVTQGSSGRVYAQQVFEFRSNPGNVYRFP